VNSINSYSKKEFKFTCYYSRALKRIKRIKIDRPHLKGYPLVEGQGEK